MSAPGTVGQALLSVHDLTPAHLPRVHGILSLLEEAGVPPGTLLVVPGGGWTEEGLSALRDLVARGYTLAGHGWVHRAVSPRSLYHRLHARVLSRDQAEHLSRPRDDVRTMVRRCFDWFVQMGLPRPDLYVPPAWAMGRLHRRDLASLPFRWYEVLTGLVEGRTGRVRKLPLVGFEADTKLRKAGLRFLNGINLRLGRRLRRPVRISIHPMDLELLLASDLRALVREPWEFVREEEALGG